MSRLFSPLGFLVIVGLLILAQAAFGHEWYEVECCDSDDCRPAQPGEVIEENGGFTIRSTGEHLPYDDERIRYGYPGHTDGRYHVCERPKYSVERGGHWDARCLYVPHRGA